MKQNRVLGITGKIGSGKSTIANIIKDEFGFDLIDVDKVYHEMLLYDDKLKKDLISTFGMDILYNNVIKRERLRKAVLSSEAGLTLLNKITHPLIFNRVKDILNSLSNKRVVIDAALLFQIGLDMLCDVVWFVECDENLLFERIIKRNNYNTEEIKTFLKNQNDLDRFKEFSKRIIQNNCTIEEIKKLIAEHLKEDGLA